MIIKKVALIEPTDPGMDVINRWKLPRLGLPILGAILKKELNIDSTIYYQRITRLDWEEVLSADLVGISTITPTAPVAYDLISKVKEFRDIPVVLGGAHPSFLPEEGLEKGADFVVRGEGEASFPELIRHLNGDTNSPDEIRGLSFRRNGGFQHNPDRPLASDLSSLPWPDFSMLRNARSLKLLPVLTSRGCPFHCSFCSVTEMFGGGYRFRNTEDVIAELKCLYKANPGAAVSFFDDNFIASRSRTKELLERMIEEGLTRKWSAQVRVDVARDPELMDLMKKSGCSLLFLGVESVNPKTLEEYHKSQTINDVTKAVEELNNRKIFAHGMFVLGSEADTYASVKETARFAKKIGLNSAQFMILTPFPGTKFFRDMKSQDRIIDFHWENYNGFHAVFNPRNMSRAGLQYEAMVRAYKSFYSSRQTLKMGLRMRWKDMVIRFGGQVMMGKWRRDNRDLLKRIRRAYRQEKPQLARQKAALDLIEG
jgi:radical SAM superfamily enzyme YgiQ (UPF0313 family)